MVYRLAEYYVLNEFCVGNRNEPSKEILEKLKELVRESYLHKRPYL